MRKFVQIVFILLLFSNCIVALEITGKVVKISDGDTITILDKDKTQHKIRLNDIDAPEKNQAFGNKSKDNLARYIAGKIVTVKYNKKDQYKRILGTVYYNNKDINLKQIEDGFVWVYKKYSKNPIYYKAEQKAKISEKGLWTDKNPIPPWDFRKQNKSKNRF